ncbi:AP2/ERF domain [Dillenia turbinata]|uniref:AP2/ERF domain n=1 Tax=Dillenia turbinata TaxID=194707 RepID=A0AAN8UA72_9MAGN
MTSTADKTVVVDWGFSNDKMQIIKEQDILQDSACGFSNIFLQCSCIPSNSNNATVALAMAMVKTEEYMGKRLILGDEGETFVPRSVKRRRRDTAAIAPRSNNHLSQKQVTVQLQNQVDQTSVAAKVKRSSRFRGVSRYEAHLWDKLSWNATQKKKGKQGAYNKEEDAARAYDLAALKYWGTATYTNFPLSEYEKEIDIMQNKTKEEYLASLRMKSSGFSRGASKYRGVARHHNNGRWEARIGRVFGNKYLYLGTYSTREEAAHAYDLAAIEYSGADAVTNSDLSNYIRWLKPGANTLGASQEPQANNESHQVPFPSNFISREGSNSSFFHKSFDNTNDPSSYQIQKILQGTVPPNTNKSSPTALGLLLRSSIFRELVKENLVSKDVTDTDDTKNEEQIGSSDESGGLSYEGVADFPFAYGSNSDQIGLLEDASSYYNQTRQFLWYNMTSMPRIHYPVMTI